MIDITYKKRPHLLREPFGTAHGIRKGTDAVLVRVQLNQSIGYGEASMPPYYPENMDTVISFIEAIKNELKHIDHIDDALALLHSRPDNYAAKCALDMALADAHCKSLGISLAQWLQLETGDRPLQSSYTIGIDKLDIMIEKAEAAKAFETLKIKLNGKNDLEIIEAIKDIRQQNIMVDANQAWQSLDEALEKAQAIHRLGVILIEQPFPTGSWDLTKKLRQESAVPIFADEDIQQIEDLGHAKDCYDGINIKLMKCGGPTRAAEMLRLTKDMNIQTMIGCMTESSCAISAAWNFAHSSDYIDLDGNLLISNDPYASKNSDRHGRYVHNRYSGIGVEVPDNNSIWTKI